jgi:predicted ATP-binding protein involved in virulence
MTTNTDKKEDNQLITIEGLIGVGVGGVDDKNRGNVELDLISNQRVYTFIGSNGVGKTKVLEALFQGEFFINKTVYDNTATIDVTNLLVSKKITYQNSHSFDFDKKNAITNKVYFGSQNKNILHKPIDLEFKAGACVFLGVKSRGDITNNQQGSLPIGTFEWRRNAHISNIMSAMTADFKSLGMSENIQSWFITRAQSDNPYQAQSDNRSVEINTLIKVLHEIDNRFESNPTDAIKIIGSHTVSLKINDKETELKNLSSGFISVLRIIQSIISGYANFTNEINLTHVKGVVFIDEIESHLHLEWQVKIIPLLKKIFPKTTFYIATHSPLILTQLQQGEAYRLVRGTDKVVRSELIEQPSKKLFDDVLDDAFDINLNQLKRDQMLKGSQTEAKKKLLDLINNVEDVV